LVLFIPMKPQPSPGASAAPLCPPARAPMVAAAGRTRHRIGFNTENQRPVGEWAQLARLMLRGHQDEVSHPTLFSLAAEAIMNAPLAVRHWSDRFYRFWRAGKGAWSRRTTRAPIEDWTGQQLREVTPFRKGPQVLIRDGDTKCTAPFGRSLAMLGP